MLAGLRGQGGARKVECMQDRAISAELTGDAQQLCRSGIAAAQVAMDGGKSGRLADTVAQPHEVDNRLGRVIDPDQLARRGRAAHFWRSRKATAARLPSLPARDRRREHLGPAPSDHQEIHRYKARAPRSPRAASPHR